MKSIILVSFPVNWSDFHYPEIFPKSLLNISGNTILGRLLDDLDSIPCIQEHLIVTSENDFGIFRYWAIRRNGPKPIRILNKSSYSEETGLGSVRDIILDLQAYNFDDDLLVIPADSVFDFSFKGFVDSFYENHSSMVVCCNNRGNSTRTLYSAIEVDNNLNVLSFLEASAPHSSLCSPLPYIIYKRDDLLMIKDSIVSGSQYHASSRLVKFLIDNSFLHAWIMTGREYWIEDSVSYNEVKHLFPDYPIKSRINNEQIQSLESFRIKRLDSSDYHMLAKLNRFSCTRNRRIESYLKGSGVKDNLRGDLAFFYIERINGEEKEQDELVLIFTLSCGMIFKPEKVNADEAFILSQYHQGKISDEQFQLETSGWDSSKWVISDTRLCDNPEAVYANSAFPSIQLVHICNNDNASSVWPSLGLPNRMGESLFWYRIVPFILDLNKKVGFNYLYLYAADNRSSTDGGRLIKHYIYGFALHENPEIGIIKSKYNNQCTFMVQSIRELMINREIFLDSFNQ